VWLSVRTSLSTSSRCLSIGRRSPFLCTSRRPGAGKASAEPLSSENSNPKLEVLTDPGRRKWPEPAIIVLACAYMSSCRPRINKLSLLRLGWSVVYSNCLCSTFCCQHRSRECALTMHLDKIPAASFRPSSYLKCMTAQCIRIFNSSSDEGV
jgi:hypothetical protein